jgi:AraC-like DNA-binding protein
VVRQQESEYSPEKDFMHPLLAKLSELSLRLTGISFIIVFPKKDGWGQVDPGEKVKLPRFCRLIQSTPEGVRHCEMCHALMTIAACSRGLTDQRCHAGAHVLVTPISAGDKESLAVLSTCRFRSGSDPDTWEEVKARGKKLGLDLKKLKKTCFELPEMTPEQHEIAQKIFSAAADVVKEIRARSRAETKLRRLENQVPAKPALEAAIEKELKKPLTIKDSGRKPGRKPPQSSKVPPLIKVATDLVDRKPNMPFTVSEIAGAARITPNHFSTLFRTYTGKSFSAYLTEKRIEMARQFLSDLTLSMGEIARMVGYEDPSYFTRRFSQVTGMTPSEYRNSLHSME